MCFSGLFLCLDIFGWWDSKCTLSAFKLMLFASKISDARNNKGKTMFAWCLFVCGCFWFAFPNPQLFTKIWKYYDDRYKMNKCLFELRHSNVLGSLAVVLLLSWQPKWRYYYGTRGNSKKYMKLLVLLMLCDSLVGQSNADAGNESRPCGN